MSKGKSYATTNRTKILDYMMKNHDKTVTVNDISLYLQEERSEVNLSTIYRYLNQLSADGVVLKYVAPKGEMASFQYIEGKEECQEHLHMQCRQCGKVIHLNCDFMNEIKQHIQNHHGFELECKNSILYGICKDCKKKYGSCVQKLGSKERNPDDKD